MEAGAVLLSLEGQPQALALTVDGSNVSGLLPVANRALVRRAADGLAAAGVRRIVVACSADSAPAVRAALEDGARGAELRLLEVPRGAGALAAVLAARDLVPSGPLVLHAGDGLVLADLSGSLERFADDGADALVLAVPARVGAPTSDRGGAVALQPRPRPAGMQVVGSLAMRAAEQLEAERGAEATLDDLPEAVRRAGGRVEEALVPRAWRYTGEAQSLLDVSALVLEELASGPLPALDGDVVVQGAVDIHPSARVRSSKLRGPVLVGPGARIQDSYVGPFTTIGAGVVLDGAEIEHSIVLAGAEVNHVGVRIEDSVIGPGARVHRTFAMPTALRLQLGAGGRVALS